MYICMYHLHYSDTVWLSYLDIGIGHLNRSTASHAINYSWLSISSLEDKVPRCTAIFNISADFVFLSHIDSMWVAHWLDGGWNQYMCWAISCLWSLSSTHTQRVGRCPTEWRLGWYGEGALCWESNGIRVSPPTTCNQSWGRASSSPHNYNQPYSVSGLSSLFLIIDYHSTRCTQPQ